MISTPIRETIAAHINARIELPGLLPAIFDDGRWKEFAALQDHDDLRNCPPLHWPMSVLERWHAGTIILVDDPAVLAGLPRFLSRKCILDDCRLDPHVSIAGDLIFLQDVELGFSTRVRGPFMATQTAFQSHTVIGPDAMLEDTFVAPFCRIRGEVWIRQSLIASHAALDGGDHPELYPQLAPRSGIRIGPDCWIGAHATILPGTEIQQGAIVGANVATRTRVQPHSIVLTDRTIPIDHALRALTPEDAELAGSAQGPAAACLPAYGEISVTPVSNAEFVINCSHHAVTMGAATDVLLFFQRGGTQSIFRHLLPGHVIDVDPPRKLGNIVQLSVSVDPPIRPHRALTRTTRFRIDSAALRDRLTQFARVTPRLRDDDDTSLMDLALQIDFPLGERSVVLRELTRAVLSLSKDGCTDPALYPPVVSYANRFLLRRVEPFTSAVASP